VDADLAERARMFGKLFTLYPAQADSVELRIRAYIDETRDIQALVISHALKRLVRKPGQFAPSVAQIRIECGRVLRERHRAAEGLDPDGGLDHSNGELTAELAERWLARADHSVLALPAGTAPKPIELPAPPQERERAMAILDATIARLQKRSRVA